MISITSNVTALRPYLDKLTPTLRASLGAAMKRVAAWGHRYLVNEKLTGQSLTARTGNTKRAVFDRVQGTDQAPQAVIGIDTTFAPGARINNDGGTIVPKNGRMLTIPLEAAKTPKGVARFTARELFNRPAAFGYSGIFIRKGVIMGRQGGMYGKGGAALTPLFALKSRVTIPAKHFMEATQVATQEYAGGEIEKAVAEALGGSHGG